jgi:hypothetical protein
MTKPKLSVQTGQVQVQFFAHLGPAVFLFDFGVYSPNVGQQGSLLIRLLAPGFDGLSAPLRRICSKYPLVLTSSLSQARDTGQCFLLLAIQAYLTWILLRSTPSLFLRCRAPS